MSRSYYNLAKKSTLMAILGVFVLTSSVFAKIPNDPSYVKQQKMWQQIGAPEAWDYSTGSKQVTVAIIDTGADTWHSDLKDNIWTNPYEVSNNNYDDDGNGLVDDINGWNFIENNNNVRTSVLDSMDDPEAIRHGTIIAGLVGAAGNNGIDGVGLNWKVKIMPLRAIASDGSGSYQQVANAVRYAIEKEVDVIGLSIVGIMDDAFLKQILKTAYDQGVVVVAAAGNDRLSGNGNLNNIRHFPVCMDSDSAENWIIGVSSVDENDKLSNFANYGSCVDLVAPGQNIFSTERYSPIYGFDVEFGGPWQGTSFSVPLVAGAAALIKSMRPDWTAKEIIANLLKNSDDIQSKNSDLPNENGFGRLNIGKAAQNAIGGFKVSNFLSKDIYYFKDKIIYTKDDGKNYFFSNTDDALVVVLTSTRALNNKSDEVIAVVKRDKYYYVQFFNQQGYKWLEKAIPTRDYLDKKTVAGVTILNDGENRKIQIKYIEKIVKRGKKATIKTDFRLYDWLDKN